jgi:hypothetical protein
MLPTAQISISMILRTIDTRTAAAWHIVWGVGTVDIHRDLLSVFATVARYHRLLLELATTNLPRIMHLCW